MTSGGISGTKRGPDFWAYVVIAAIGLAVVAINATSELLEAGRDGDRLDWREPVIWELSSFLALMAFSPLIALAGRRWPVRQNTRVSAGLIHLGLTIPFSLIHVGAMVGLRKLAYLAFGDFYEFSHHFLARELFYEWRKDVLTYGLILATFGFFRWRAHVDTLAKPSEPERIEIRDSGRTVFIGSNEITWIEAAGNYVEIHAVGRVHLVRGALAAFEQRLTPHGFLRVHRSRLINRAQIRAMKPTPSGDMELTMTDGTTLIASRRYRAALEAS